MNYRFSWVHTEYGTTEDDPLWSDTKHSQIIRAGSDGQAIDEAEKIIERLTVDSACSAFQLLRIDVEEVSTPVKLPGIAHGRGERF